MDLEYFTKKVTYIVSLLDKFYAKTQNVFFRRKKLIFCEQILKWISNLLILDSSITLILNEII